ncbi:MAG: DUF6498-containing protein [bacterium]
MNSELEPVTFSLLRPVRSLPVSALILIGINLLPILGVLHWGWNLVDIIFLYWAESVIIGLSALLKMLIARIDEVGLPMRVVTVVMRIVGFLFFMLHLGGFLAALGLAFYFFVQEFLDASVRPLSLLATTWPVLVALLASHGFSFVVNFLIKGERQIFRGEDPITTAYSRVLVLHLTLAFGVGPVIFLGQPLYLLVIFIVLKIATDLWGHLRERRKFGTAHR